MFFAMLCPITSIFVGINILKNVASSPGGFFKKMTYAVIGSLATIGLGCVITAIQTVYTLFTVVISTIGYGIFYVEDSLDDHNIYIPLLSSTWSALDNAFDIIEDVLRNGKSVTTKDYNFKN